jgi:hypothetical protein
MKKKNKLILIFVLISLLFLINKSKFSNEFTSEKRDIIKKIYNGDEWNNYRLGDVYDHWKHVYDINHHENIFYHKDQYKGTLANEYINKNETGKKNPELLVSIIEKKVKDKFDYPDTLFLHIRTGDSMCGQTEYLKNINGPLIYSKKGDTVWWNNIVNYIKINNINKVVIISGSHFNICLEESADYLIDRKKFLKDNLSYLEFSFKLGQSPDDDVLMCVYVKHFQTTGGGYGNLIKEINNLFKNEKK